MFGQLYIKENGILKRKNGSTFIQVYYPRLESPHIITLENLNFEPSQRYYVRIYVDDLK